MSSEGEAGLLEIEEMILLAAFEEVSEAVEFGIGQRLVLGESFPWWPSAGFASILRGIHSSEPSILNSSRLTI